MLFDQNNPIYIQIGELICENIIKGIWKEGERLPSVREFAISMEVNPNTVNRTYTTLQEKNIIFNQRGIGYFVSPGAENMVLEMQKEVFIEEELPRIIKKLKLLKITMEDFTQLYTMLQ